MLRSAVEKNKTIQLFLKAIQLVWLISEKVEKLLLHTECLEKTFLTK